MGEMMMIQASFIFLWMECAQLRRQRGDGIPQVLWDQCHQDKWNLFFFLILQDVWFPVGVQNTWTMKWWFERSCRGTAKAQDSAGGLSGSLAPPFLDTALSFRLGLSVLRLCLCTLDVRLIVSKGEGGPQCPFPGHFHLLLLFPYHQMKS